MLRNAAFTDSAHKDAVRKKLRSESREITMDELEMVAGGVTHPVFQLLDNSFDELINR